MARTQTEKLWLLGTALVGFVVVLIGYFFFISPQRDSTDQVTSQIADAQTQNLTLQGKITALAAQNKNLASYKQQLAQAQLALPSTSGMPDFLRSLQSIGAQTATTVSSLTVGAPTGLDGAAPSAASPATSSGSSSGSSESASPAPSTTDTAAAPSGVYAIPITASVTGSAGQLSAFLTQLQSVQPRAVLITEITQGSATPAATTTSRVGGGQTSLQLTMQAFVAPPASAAAPVAATPTTSPTAGA